jgi:enoyl-CoA hydratase
MSEQELVLTEIKGKVGLITLNRPEAYNALNQDLLSGLMSSLANLDQDQNVGALVITGNDKSFAAGADISSMAEASVEEMKNSSFIPTFHLIQEIKKPIIAAVSGYCLGGGLELAMSCDMIIASSKTKFGQPEINLGIIPGAGGTQRLTLAVGKTIAMEMILNNRILKADEARERGLINSVYPVEEYLDQALSLAQEIAERAPLAVQAGKKAINQAFESSLKTGLVIEREIFFDLFSTQDQKEGMQAFLDKRAPEWSGS